MEAKTISAGNIKVQKGKSIWRKDLINNWSLLLMMIPGVIFFIAFHYIPMFGVTMAFKNMNYQKGFFGSDWVGFRNFEFFIKTPDAFIITRNTLLYNLVFIVFGLILAVFLAISLNEVRNVLLSKMYQTIMFFPHFISWVVVSYLSLAFFSTSYGFINKSILEPLGIGTIAWYSEAKYWPFIITAFHFWKTLGYSTVVYLAAITGIPDEYYEAAAIDGASKWRQIISITLPCLKTLMTILTILAVGNIFDADFGLFYQTTLNSGALYSTTNVINTYVYRAMQSTGDLGMSTAASLYQSSVGFILVLVTNMIVRKVDEESSLF